MFSLIDERSFANGVGSPQNKTYSGTPGADCGNNGIGEFFPSEMAVTSGGMRINGKNAVEQKNAGNRPFFQRTGTWDFPVEIGGIFFENIP